MGFLDKLTTKVKDGIDTVKDSGILEHAKDKINEGIEVISKESSMALDSVKESYNRGESDDEPDFVLEVNGIKFNAEQLNETISICSGCSWDAQSQTLILDNYNGSSITAYRNLNLYLADESNNTVENLIPDENDVFGILVFNGNLYIDGFGKLTVISNDFGIASQNNLVINHSKITATGKKVNGISSTGRIFIAGDAEIEIKNSESGIVCMKDAVVTDSSITISNVITGGIAIENGNLSINGSKIIINDSNESGIDINNGSMYVNGDSEIVVNSKGDGIFASGDSVIFISNGNIKVNVNSFGIFSDDGSIFISEDNSTKIDLSGEMCIASGGGDIVITGGSINASSIQSKDNISNCILSTKGSIKIFDGDIVLQSFNTAIHNPEDNKVFISDRLNIDAGENSSDAAAVSAYDNQKYVRIHRKNSVSLIHNGGKA